MHKLLLILIVFLSSISTSAAQSVQKILPVKEAATLLPNEGFSFDSLWRGVLGMLCLLVIAYLLSVNKKTINWKTVGVGLRICLEITCPFLWVLLPSNCVENTRHSYGYVCVFRLVDEQNNCL